MMEGDTETPVSPKKVVQYGIQSWILVQATTVITNNGTVVQDRQHCIGVQIKYLEQKFRMCPAQESRTSPAQESKLCPADESRIGVLHRNPEETVAWIVTASMGLEIPHSIKFVPVTNQLEISFCQVHKHETQRFAESLMGQDTRYT